MSADSNGIAYFLQQEIALVEALNKLIAEEREVLIQKNYEMLSSIADKKEEIAVQLNGLTKERIKHVCNADNPEHYQEALPAYLAKLDENTRNEVHRLNTLLGENLVTCKTNNAVNGQVITANIQIRENLLETMGASGGQGATYGEQGQVDRLRNSSHHHEA